jgi:two-component system phosphate regulon response regulator PhoB
MHAPVHILLVEDEQDSADILSNFLSLKGYEIEHIADGDVALDRLKTGGASFALAILDIMLPGTPGTDVLAFIRASPQLRDLPVLLLTAKDREHDEIEGLRLGADDYLTKPVSLNRLLARVQTLLRRSPLPAEEPITIGRTVLVPAEMRVTHAGEELTLTATEFQILKLMMSQPGRVFSRQDILQHIATEEKPVFDRTVDAHIKNLRTKLGGGQEVIKTYRGMGYGVPQPGETP